MNMRLPLLLLAGILAVASRAQAEDRGGPQSVIYIGNAGSERAAEYAEFLQRHFDQVTVADRKTFDPASAKDAGVVLLDWSQADARFPNDPSPLGSRDEWSRPTVLLGSAGLLLAMPWDLIGGSG
jgi:hypothetical protein